MTQNTQWHTWMDNTPWIEHLRIDELILPGTHDSGTDKKAPRFMLPMEITQDVPIIDQIIAGFRVIDLRVRFYSNEPANSPTRFQLFHLNSSGRTIAGDVLDKLNDFYNAPTTRAARVKEVIILNFHQFDLFDNNAHRELQTLINQKMGNRLLFQDFKYSTLGDIWANQPGRTIVISYNSDARQHDYWRGIRQQWSGSNLNSTTTLKTFMDEKAAEKKPDYELRSIQCAKYVLPFFVPDDFTDKVDQWFHSQDENSYIQGFYIINTDWSTRSRIVQNCYLANQFRAQKKQKRSLNAG